MNIKCEANANQQYLIIMLYSSFYTLRGSLNTRAVFSVFGLYANPFTAAFTYVDAMLHFLLSYLPSICSMHIYLPPLSLSLFISLTLQHTLGCQAAIQTSSEEKLSFLSNTLQSIVSPYVVNKREDTGENDIADDCK